MKNSSGVKPVRNKNGTIRKWPGGKSIGQYTPKWQNNNQHGIRTHIGQVWSSQHKRRPRIGDIVRTKNKDGSYHRGAFWYVRTRYGWRVTTSQRKPSPATIKRICGTARPCRKK